MSHPLIDLTEQEIFDKAYLGLASQGFERSMINDSCVYNAGDRHCAVGWVCVESKMPREGERPNKLSFWESLGINTMPSKERTNFLQEIQYVHDASYFEHNDQCAKRKQRMEEFAKIHNLTVPAIPHSEPVPKCRSLIFA